MKTLKEMKYYHEKMMVNGREVFRIRRDSNGNPRYVVHFLELVRDVDGTIEMKWREALKRAKAAGGKQYRAKWFGGGIVFQSYNIEHTLKDLIK